jgi:uncharacterized protein (DUF2236 family)
VISPPTDGFSDSSQIRRVHRENVVLLGGGRALLLQIAHPAVAAAVAEHSTFRERKNDRLLRTLRRSLALVFGDPMQVAEAAASVNAIHGGVRGSGYCATDPDLLFWVLATLIETALTMHARFLRPLDALETQAYYDQMLTAGAMLGVRAELVPSRFDDFQDYWDDRVARLEVTPAARQIAGDLFAARMPFQPAFAGLRELTAWLLPERLRGAFGFTIGRNEDRAFDVLSAVSRLVLPRMPARLRAPASFLLPKRG